MAEQVTSHVVKEAQSVDRPAPIDDTASATNSPATNGELPLGPTTTHAIPSVSIPDATDTATRNAKDSPVNGDSGDLSATESHAIADGSGGSDTDISRPGSVDQSKREPAHVRTGSNAVKKPSTFKSVSVTKNFLAKSAVSTPVARPGDKATATAPASAASLLTVKPRLVAKLGTGNTPRALGKANGVTSGPDASKVWNKNQPVPPAPLKQFTDEELKQQYGIHLATRLQADESGKEAKWADIDDDEDDWAPEAVQWMDGTKSSAAVLEPEPIPVEEPKTIDRPREMPAEAQRPTTVTNSNTIKASVTGGTKTILKPGGHVQPPTGKSSLVLKGQPEKPTLVAKPSSSDKKSPWATLPPVEKVPPVHFNPPQQQPPQQRLLQRDSYGYEPMPSLPAKEIAPDDFNRSWRDDRGGRPELFNSQSGRYEPVNDMRRGSNRDSGLRQQPSVLQRPQDGPAEPSAAFQTSRSSGDMPTWGRRRNSSNVSGGNGRRMSFDRRPPDMPTGPGSMDRRSSHSVNGIEPSESGPSKQPPLANTMSPSISQAIPASPYGSVASSNAQEAHVPVRAAPVEDPVEVQKRLMADKIERARTKKQQEQEAEKREEAERKERLAKRLAALGPPTEKPKTKDQSPARTIERSPQKSKATPVTMQSPPKPPVPTADGEVAQYGMMKVHQAQPVKKLSPVDPSSSPAAAAPGEPNRGQSPLKPQADGETKPTPLTQQSTPPFDALARDIEPQSTSQHSESSASVGTKSHGAPSGWQPAAPHHPRPWTSQVWGPPQAKDRALGNGTFGSSYDRSQPRSVQQPLSAQSQPPPVASVNLNLAPQQSSIPPAGSVSTTQTKYSQAGPLSAQASKSIKPGPIAPPSEKSWGNFAAHIAQDDRNMAVKARQDLERLGGETFRPELRETYKDQRGQSQTTLHDKVGGHLALHPGGLKKDDAAKLVHDGPRASRFFPRSSEPASQTTATALSKMDSPPPPPETESHPAFAGNTSHPLVKLPKPSPVVKLPPPAQASQAVPDAPVSMPTRGNPGLGARPLAMNPEWQARFNRLLEKPGAPSAPTAHQTPVQMSATRPSTAASTASAAAKPIAASSKATLEVRGGAGPATVSLPGVPTRRIFSDDRGRDVITRRGTEVLFEDREFGSLPTVRLSKVPHLAASEAVVAPPAEDSLLIRFKRIENPFTTRRLEVFDIEKGVQRIDVIIHLDHKQTPITKSMQRRSRWAKTTNQYTKPKRNGTANATSTMNTKDRPRKVSQQGQGDRPNSSPRPGTSSTWNSNNNNRSTPAHQTTTWARLAAASVQ